METRNPLLHPPLAHCYNSAILSRLLTKYEASENARALALIKKMSSAEPFSSS